MRKTDEIKNYGAVTSQVIDMGDWDAAFWHFLPTSNGNFLVEASLDAGATWIQVSTVAIVLGTAQRVVTAAPVEAMIRGRFSAGNGTALRVQRKRTS